MSPRGGDAGDPLIQNQPDRAVQEAQPSKARYIVLAFLAAMTFVLYLDRVCIGQAAPMIQKDLGLTEGQKSLVFGAFTLAYALFEIPTGHWGDRYGSRGVLTRIVVWWSIFTALTGASFSIWMLIAIRFLFGAGEAGALPNSARVLKSWFPSQALGRAQGFVTTAMLLGGAVAPVFSQKLIDSVGWRYSFAIFGILGLCWAAAFYYWFRDDPARHPAVNHAERNLILKERIGSRGGHHGAIPWDSVLKSKEVWLLSGAMVNMAGIYYMLFSWYPTYLQNARGVSPDLSAWLSSLVLGLGASGCLIGGWLTDYLVRTTGNKRWGRTAQAVGGSALAAIAILLSVQAENAVLSAVLVAIACLGVQLQVPAWWASASQVSGRHTGAIFGFMNMIGSLGGNGSQLFLGYFADYMKGLGYTGRAQWDPGFAIYSGVALLGVVLWSLLDPRHSVDDPPANAPPADGPAITQ